MFRSTSQKNRKERVHLTHYAQRRRRREEKKNEGLGFLPAPEKREGQAAL